MSYLVYLGLASSVIRRSFSQLPEGASSASPTLSETAELHSWPDTLVPEFHVSEYENMYQLLAVSSSWGDHQWI